ncbi:MAG: CRTAC1 family protein [Gemmatimonadota bacterium]
MKSGSMVLLAVALLGCEGSGAPDRQPASSVRMAERLAQLADSANPMEDEQLNIQRLQQFLESEPPPDPAAMILRQGLIAQEMLHAGNTAPATEQLMMIRQLLMEAGQEPLPGFLRTLDELIEVGLLRRGLEQACPDQATGRVFPCWIEVPPRPSDVSNDSADATLGRAALWQLALMDDRADDLRARWQLNLAFMAAGTWPDSVPEDWLIPPEAFADGDTIPRFEEVARRVGLDVVSVSGGGIVDDFTGDHLPDVMVSSRGLRDPLRYFESDGAGSFVERTAEAGLEGLVGGLNLVHADYDNDGDADVLVLRGGWLVTGYPNSLLRNDGDGTFTDVTEAAGLYSEHPTQTAAWADYDGDGWLDLFIGNESRDGTTHRSELFRNQGDGTFLEMAAAVGLDVGAFVKGVTWGDYDDDGRPDLYVSILQGPNRLFRNEGPATAGGWRFEDVTARAGVAEPYMSFPTWFWDFDNDGHLDLFAAGYAAQVADIAAEYLGRPHEAELPRVYRNNGDGTFADVTAAVGMNRISYAMGSNFGDLDNDGLLDVFLGTGDPDYRQLMPNRVFRNLGNRFAEVTTTGGFGLIDKGHGVSFVDVDNDGDQDIHMVLGGAHQGDLSRNVLYENPGFGNDWITLELVGETANRSGMGARITIELEGPDGVRRIHRAASTGGSFGANTLRQEIGLGANARIGSIEIRWPGSGTVDTLRSVAPNAAYRVMEGSGRADPLTRPIIDLGG